MATQKKVGNKSLSFIIQMGIYPFDVMVSIGQTDVQLANSLEPFKDNLTERDYELCKYPSDKTQGRAVMFSNNASLLRLRCVPKTPEDHGHLAHEIFHVATFVMDRIGTKLEVMVSDEPYAYLIEFLTREIHEVLHVKKPARRNWKLVKKHDYAYTMGN